MEWLIVGLLSCIFALAGGSYLSIRKIEQMLGRIQEKQIKAE